jgi:glycosyltransferase involved in cell wall biosynthesis
MKSPQASSIEVVQCPLLLEGVRIARISTVPFFIIAQLAAQVEALVAQGAAVTIVSSDGPELRGRNPIAGAHWTAIEIPRSLSPFKDLLALLRLFFFFKRTRTQIAHSTTPKAGLLTALAAYLAGVPVRVHTFTGQPWVNMRGFKRWLVRGCDRLIGLLNTVCYADSPSQREFLLAEGLLTPGKLKVIGAGSLAGVDVDRFSRARFSAESCVALRQSLGIGAHIPVLLFVGRITAEKGIRELMQAFAGVKRQGSTAHLLIVGQFDDDGGMPGSITREEITRHADAHIIGYTERPEAYMAIADILCLPSYREGFGTVVIEAASLGVPTVGSHIYGLSDAVKQGETGLLVDPRDSASLQAALLQLLADDALRARMGLAARQRAYTLFDAKRVNAAVVQDYASLLGALRETPERQP